MGINNHSRDIKRSVNHIRDGNLAVGLQKLINLKASDVLQREVNMIDSNVLEQLETNQTLVMVQVYLLLNNHRALHELSQKLLHTEKYELLVKVLLKDSQAPHSMYAEECARRGRWLQVRALLPVISKKLGEQMSTSGMMMNILQLLKSSFYQSLSQESNSQQQITEQENAMISILGFLQNSDVLREFLSNAKETSRLILQERIEKALTKIAIKKSKDPSGSYMVRLQLFDRLVVENKIGEARALLQEIVKGFELPEEIISRLTMLLRK